MHGAAGVILQVLSVVSSLAVVVVLQDSITRSAAHLDPGFVLGTILYAEYNTKFKLSTNTSVYADESELRIQAGDCEVHNEQEMLPSETCRRVLLPLNTP